MLATNLAAAGRAPDDPAAITSAVVAASRSDTMQLRSAAAFTLGVVGSGHTSADRTAADRLTQLTTDPNDDVRYNAALGLARLGDDGALETLGEMLDLPDTPAPAEKARDDAAQSKRYKRALVVLNALRGVALLADATHAAPPPAIMARVEKLAQDPVGDVRAAATALATKIERLSAAPAGK